MGGWTEFVRAFQNLYVALVVGFLALALIVIVGMSVLAEIRQPGTICGIAAAATGHSGDSCRPQPIPGPSPKPNLTCGLTPLADKQYLWRVMPAGSNSLDVADATVNITEDEEVRFTFTSKGNFWHEFAGKCENYSLPNNLNSGKIVVGTFTRQNLGDRSDKVTALAFLVKLDQGFAFLWCPAPIADATPSLSKGTCASGSLSPE
jgi:hypothetical protein